MEITKFRQLETALNELQGVTEFSVVANTTTWPDKVEKLSQLNVNASGEFTELLARYLNNNQANILKNIKAAAAKRLAEARLAAVAEAETFVAVEKAVL